MIEIIQEENWSDADEKRDLPKDIKQIGTPDVGDRIYIENNAYQKMHSCTQSSEKMVYIMLGCFDEFTGSTCIFIEDVIKMNEVEFNGKLPIWNEESWGYLYRKLKPEHENMIIVGWAIDICGQVPSMTAQLERVHQTYFGGIHQVLLLLDTLEREEAFFSNRNGYLKRREGFFIYYDKNIPERLGAMIEERKAEKQEKEAIHDYETGTVSDRQKNYRAYLNHRKGMKAVSRPVYKKSYSSTMLLVAVIAALGYSAFRNYEKMEHMQLTLNQMDEYQAVMQSDVENENQVKVEDIEGTITPIETTETLLASSAQNEQNEMTQADNSSEINTEMVTESITSQEETIQEETIQEEVPSEESSSQEITETLSEAETYLAQGYYVVQSGDNLAGICRKIYHTTAMLQQLCQVNEIENPDAIYVGQHLKLPN